MLTSRRRTDPAPGGSPVHASTPAPRWWRASGSTAPHASREDKNVVVRGGPGSLRVEAGGEIADDAAPEKLAAGEKEREGGEAGRRREGERKRASEQEFCTGLLA